jgi:hypothetical protein
MKHLRLLVLLLAPAPAALAQFICATNKGAITIAEYAGAERDVVIPSRITGHPVRAIGYRAFSFSTLTNLTIPDSVTTIGEGAFEHCSDLTSVTIPDTVTTIGECAFYLCPSLTSVALGANLTNIAAAAFSSCANLTNVLIPSSVASIGPMTFASCRNMTAIRVEALNASYSSVAGVLFNKTQTTLTLCPGGKAGDYVIPNSVLEIGGGAFRGCARLTSVTIPAGVTRIGPEAFEACPGLKALYFRGNAPSQTRAVFDDRSRATIYYLPGTTGWGPQFGGRPTAVWKR